MKLTYTKAPTKETKSSSKQTPGHHVTYSPNSPWWEPPLSAWVPSNNREVLFFYIIVIITMVLAARFTPFCGIQPAGSNNFCSPGWIFENDHILKFVSAGMFFMVAFRANQSYAKWWEGRCMWGLIWKVSRDMSHLMCCHITVVTDEDEAELRRIIGFVSAIPFSTKDLLRKEKNLQKELAGLLSDEDLIDIEVATHSPYYCLDVIGHYLAKQAKAGKLSDHQLATINSCGIIEFSSAIGAMERLRNSFIPVTYALHQRFIVFSWLILLGLHFLDKYNWYTIPLASAVGYIVLGIDSMACEIEEPFGHDKNDLDLSRFCAGIRRDTQDIYGRKGKFGTRSAGVAEIRQLRAPSGSRKIKRKNSDTTICTFNSSSGSSEDGSDGDIEQGINWRKTGLSDTVIVTDLSDTVVIGTDVLECLQE